MMKPYDLLEKTHSISWWNVHGCCIDQLGGCIAFIEHRANLLVWLGGQHHICITSYDIMCTYDIYVYIYTYNVLYYYYYYYYRVYYYYVITISLFYLFILIIFVSIYTHSLSIYIHILCVYIYIDTSNVSRLETSQSSPRPFFSRRVSRWSNRISGVMLRRRARRAGHVVDVGDTTTGCLWSVYIYIYPLVI